MPNKCIKKYSILYILFVGEIGQSEQAAMTQWDEVSRKLVRQFAQGEYRIS